MTTMRSLIALLALGFFGCSVDTNALRSASDSHAPVKGPGVGLDGGTPSTPDTLPSTPDVLPVSPDATPGTDGIAADLLGVAPDLLPPDAGLALDGLARPTDTSPASDLRPVTLDVLPATPDVLPAPDLAPECPYIAWMTRPSTAEEQWGIKMTVPETATCFTVCGSLRYLWLDPAGARSVKINDKAATRQLDPVAGYLPNLADGPYVFRIGAGDPIVLAVAGYPTNTTGACP